MFVYEIYELVLTIDAFFEYVQRFRLEVEIKDDTNQTIVVMWDETATELTKSSAKALLDELEQVFMEAAFPLFDHVPTICIYRLSSVGWRWILSFAKCFDKPV